MGSAAEQSSAGWGDLDQAQRFVTSKSPIQSARENFHPGRCAAVPPH
jgi:hypothetical protein